MTTASNVSVRRYLRSPTVLVIFASTLVAVMGVSLVSPALPTVQDAWGITEPQASLLLSAFTLPGIFLTPFVGLLSDRVGRKRVLVPSLFVFGLSGSAVVVADSFTAILALRVVQGTAGSAITSLTITLLGDLYAGDVRSTLIGLNAATIAVGAAGYPLLGGLLATVSWAAPFVCFGLGVVVAVAGAALLDEPARDDAGGGLTYVRDAVRGVPTRPVVTLYVAIFGVFVLLYGAQLTAVPFVLDSHYHLPPDRIGLLVPLPAVTMGLTASQTSRLLGWLTSTQLIAAGVGTYGVGLLTVSTAPSLVGVAGGLLLFGVGQGLSEPITDTALNELTPDEFRGGVMSVRTSVLRLGTTVGPPLFIGVAALVGYFDTLFLVGVAALVVGGTSLVVGGTSLAVGRYRLAA